MWVVNSARKQILKRERAEPLKMNSSMNQIKTCLKASQKLKKKLIVMEDNVEEIQSDKKKTTTDILTTIFRNVVHDKGIKSKKP